MSGSVGQSAKHIETRVETYVFDKNITLTATVTYINDVPLVHTKTIVFDYNGHHFDVSDKTSAFNLILMRNALRPLYVVELVNYMSRVYNHDNMFQIYKTEKTDARVADMLSYVFGSEDHQKSVISTGEGCPSPLQNDDLERLAVSNYIEGLCADKRRFITSELQKHINPSTPLVAKSFDDFKHVPIFGYVHPTLATNRGDTVPFMHLAVVVNILAHNPAFSLLNSQSAVAMFGSMMKAKRFDETVEEVTIQSLEEAKRYIKHILNENRSLKMENATLTEMVDELLQRSKKQEALLEEQMEVVGILDTRDIERKAESKKLMKKVDHLTSLSEAQSLDHDILLERTAEIAGQVQSLNASNHDANHTLDLRWILYTSASNPAPPDYVKGTPANCIWIMSHARENKNVRLPNDAVILLDTEMVNRSVYEDAIASLTPEDRRDMKSVDLTDVPEALYVRLWRRHIMVKRDKAVEFVQRVQAYLTERGVHPDINMERLQLQLHANRARQDLVEETVDSELEKEQWKHDFIAGNDRYVYHTARWRRLYAKTDDGYTTELTDTNPWYVRTGRGGAVYTKLPFGMLTEMRYRSNGDPRITYE